LCSTKCFYIHTHTHINEHSPLLPGLPRPMLPYASQDASRTPASGPRNRSDPVCA
jgi:hypothetical protein